MSNTDKYKQAITDYGSTFTLSEFSPRSGTSATDIAFPFFTQFLKFRQWHGYSTLITSAYRPGDDGAHGDGLAIDFIMFTDWMDEVVPPWEQWRLATTWPWWGVGIYFDWQYRADGKSQPAVGLHVDIQESGTRPLRWLRMEDDKYNNLYYYQNRNNGNFYNRSTQKSVELSSVIEKVWSS